MPLAERAHWGVAGALLSAAGWLASGIVAFMTLGVTGGLRDLPVPIGENPEWFAIEALHAVGELGMLPALVAIAALQTPDYGRWGSIGYLASLAGTALVLVATVLGLAFPEGNLLVGVSFGLGMLGWLIGFPVLGAATLRTPVFPRWAGWLLIAFLPLVVVVLLVLDLTGIGGVLAAALWLALGLAVMNAARSGRPARS